VLVAAYAIGGPKAGTNPIALPCNTPPLIVAASNEKSALLTDLAAEFVRTRPEVDGTCITVKVVRKASGDAEEALARGWNEQTDGPQPHVWSPAAKTWVEILRVHRVGSDRSDLIPSSLPSLMQSPLIIAMPRPLAEALGWPDRPIGWHDVLGLARDDRGWARSVIRVGSIPAGQDQPNGLDVRPARTDRQLTTRRPASHPISPRPTSADPTPCNS
jgi:Ca-activated chloride channel family protein